MTSRENQEYIGSKAHRICQQWEIVSKLTISHNKERNYYCSYYQDISSCICSFIEYHIC